MVFLLQASQPLFEECVKEPLHGNTTFLLGRGLRQGDRGTEYQYITLYHRTPDELHLLLSIGYVVIMVNPIRRGAVIDRVMLRDVILCDHVAASLIYR